MGTGGVAEDGHMVAVGGEAVGMDEVGGEGGGGLRGVAGVYTFVRWRCRKSHGTSDGDCRVNPHLQAAGSPVVTLSSGPAVAIILCCWLLAAASACDSGSEEGQSATPTVAQATAPATGPLDGGPERPGDDGFRAFASSVDRALQQGDIAFFAQRLLTTHVVCTEEQVPPEVGDPACDYVGQEFDGLLLGHWRGHGTLAPAEATLQRIRRLTQEDSPDTADAFGGGGARVYALDFAAGDGVTIATALVDGKRQVLGIAWTWADDSWRITSTLGSVAPVALELLEPSQLVLDSLYPRWGRFTPN